MGEFVRLEVEDGIGTIRLDRPKMNAISFQVQAEQRLHRPLNNYPRQNRAG